MRPMTEEELDACGLYVNDVQSDENYTSDGEVYGTDYSYQLTILTRKTDQSEGPQYIVQVEDGNRVEYIGCESLAEAIDVASRLTPFIAFAKLHFAEQADSPSAYVLSRGRSVDTEEVGVLGACTYPAVLLGRVSGPF